MDSDKKTLCSPCLNVVGIYVNFNARQCSFALLTAYASCFRSKLSADF